MDLNPNSDFAETLRQAHREEAGVTLYLRSGETLQGRVGAVGDQHVVVSHLTNREFYDAVVRIGDVSAIEVRARQQ